MLKAFGRSTSGIHARPRKMVRFCCSVKPSQLWWGLPHPHHQLDFPHHPSKTANTLASLVKGEVLSPEKIRATTGGIVTLTFAPHPTLAKPHYPSKIANTLASLVKGRWIDGKAQTVALLCLNCDTPALFITKPFCRQDGGIAAPTFAPHYPTRFSCCEFDSLTSHKNKIRPRFHGGELISISLSGVWGVAPMWVVGRWCRCVVQRLCATDYKRPCLVRATAPLPAKIKSAPVFTGANSSSH